MVERHTVEEARHDPADIPPENAERRDDELAVFEWYCPACEEWLGWPENPAHAALVCADPAACPHADDGACGHVVCGECESPADSHEWVLAGEQARRVARQVFDGTDRTVETAFRKALVEDLQQVTRGESVEDVLRERQDLFEEYVEAVGEQTDRAEDDGSE